MTHLPRHPFLVLAVVGILTAGCSEAPQRASAAATDASTATASSPSEGPSSSSTEQPTQGHGRLELDEQQGVSVEQARQQVDFPVAAPPTMPARWEPAGSRLVTYDGNGDGAVDATHYILSFQPEGADAEAHSGLSIRQATDTGRPADFEPLETTTLDDGTVAYLTDPPDDLPAARSPGGRTTATTSSAHRVCRSIA